MHRVIGLGVVAMALGIGACTIHTTPEIGYAEVSTAPVAGADFEAYPHTDYDGRTVYYINNRWMYRDRGAWAYYRNEPPELYRHRTVIQQAPPAYRAEPRYTPRYEPGDRQVPNQAPPAQRVE